MAYQIKNTGSPSHRKLALLSHGLAGTEKTLSIGRFAQAGFNPLVTGDDDGTVSVSSTRLSGAADFLTVYSMHAHLPGAEETCAAVEQFFRTGAFRDSGVREPIP